jgi:hypothetical protein
MPTGYFPSDIGIAFDKMLLKERQKVREDEEEEVRSYRMILRKKEDTRI